MSQFGTGQFGTASFGGDPDPALIFDIDAEITTRARDLLARGSTDGTGIKTIKFSIGTGGYSPFDYTRAVPVNPDSTDLDFPLPFLTPDGRKVITEYERPNSKSGCTYCVVDALEGNAPLGEVGIWAKILYSPFTHELGDIFLAAIAHFPLVAKNSSMRYAFRVNVHF